MAPITGMRGIFRSPHLQEVIKLLFRHHVDYPDRPGKNNYDIIRDISYDL